MLAWNGHWFKIRKPFKGILIAFFSLVGGTWGFVEWDVRKAEAAIWDEGDFTFLEKREPLLRWVVNSRATPSALRGRALGLLGDIDFHAGRFESASKNYLDSLRTFENIFADRENAPDEPWDPEELRRFYENEAGAFANGVRDYRLAPFIGETLDDNDLVPDLKDLADEENARFALAEIPRLSGADAAVGQHLFSQASDPEVSEANQEIVRFCQSQLPKLEALWNLGDRFALEFPNDVEPLIPAADFVRLAALDAFSQAHLGKRNRAAKSLDAAYRLLGYLEQSPSLKSGLGNVALRASLLEIFRTAYGKPASALFEERHRIVEDPYRWFVKGEYHSLKRTFETSLTGTSAQEKRFRQILLRKHLDYHRLLLAGVHNAKRRGEFDEMVATWFHKQRRYLHRGKSASYPEGLAFAESLEDATVEIVHWMGVSNLGRIDEAMDEVTEGERELLSRRRSPGSPPQPDFRSG